jgi:hypothetical protein
MRLDAAGCEERLRRSDHGVLSTLHPDRGVDAVPACFVVVGSVLAVPVDRVKPKGSARLQRVRNLEGDPRAALLCEHWNGSDWSDLWWVRASLLRVSVGGPERSRFESLLRLKYPPYEGQPFHDVLVFRITELAGWTSAEGGRRIDRPDG